MFAPSQHGTPEVMEVWGLGFVPGFPEGELTQKPKPKPARYVINYDFPNQVEDTTPPTPLAPFEVLKPQQNPRPREVQVAQVTNGWRCCLAF